MWRILELVGFPPKILNVLRSLYNGSYAVFRINGKVGEWFEMFRGLKQGCGIAPLLFNIFFGEVIRVIVDKLDGKGIKLRVSFGGECF